MTALATRAPAGCEAEDDCIATPVVRFQGEVLCYEHGKDAGAAHCEGCHRLFDAEDEGDTDIGPDGIDLCGECCAEEDA